MLSVTVNIKLLWLAVETFQKDQLKKLDSQFGVMNEIMNSFQFWLYVYNWLDLLRDPYLDFGWQRNDIPPAMAILAFSGDRPYRRSRQMIGSLWLPIHV